MKALAKQKKKETKSPTTVFEMTCCSNPKEIAKIENFVKQISKKLRFDDGTMYRLLLACTEAVNNAIIHGNKANPEKKVIIRCIVKGQSLNIDVTDEGKGFNSKILQDPRDEKNLMKEHGRGIFLMRSMMDKVIFKRLKTGYVVGMKMKLHSHH